MTYYRAEIDECDSMLANVVVNKHKTFIECLTAALTAGTWGLSSADWDYDDYGKKQIGGVLEFRSDRNHLAICVISQNKTEAIKRAIEEFNKLWCPDEIIPPGEFTIEEMEEKS